jgi:hypothetical protein
MGDLEKIVRAERKKLIETALATGEVDKDAADRIDRLTKLANDAHPPRRWVVPAVAFALLTIFVGLLAKEQHETEIELDCAVTELHFRVPRMGPLTEDQFLRALSASDLDGIEVDGADWPAPRGSTCSFHVELVSPLEEKDAVTISGLILPKSWEVGVSRSGAETVFEFTAPSLSPAQENFAIGAALRGRAALSSNCTPDGNNRTVLWSGPGSLTMRIGAAATLRGNSSSPVKFARQIEFDDLRFYAVERYQNVTAPIDRRRSSVLKGTLYLDALNSKALTLRPYEALSFSSSKGYLRAISIPADSRPGSEDLRVQAHATVQEMMLGSGANRRSQMPSWLELLAAQTGIALLWACVIYVFGIVYATLKWMSVTR